MLNTKLLFTPIIYTILSGSLLLIYLMLNFVEIASQNFYVIVTTIIVIVTVNSLLKLNYGLTLMYLIYLYLTHLGIPLIDLFMNDPFININVNADWYYKSVREQAIVYS